MDSNDDLQGAEANPGGAMADQIVALQLQVAQLTQLLQSGVKMEAVSGVEDIHFSIRTLSLRPQFISSLLFAPSPPRYFNRKLMLEIGPLVL